MRKVCLVVVRKRIAVRILGIAIAVVLMTAIIAAVATGMDKSEKSASTAFLPVTGENPETVENKTGKLAYNLCLFVYIN